MKAGYIFSLIGSSLAQDSPSFADAELAVDPVSYFAAASKLVNLGNVRKLLSQIDTFPPRRSPTSHSSSQSPSRRCARDWKFRTCPLAPRQRLQASTASAAETIPTSASPATWSTEQMLLSDTTGRQSRSLSRLDTPTASATGSPTSTSCWAQCQEPPKASKYIGACWNTT
ncbi:hypothetical protein DSO57_1012632 [Entomophthora muscae]|uniref:Uncharacterized protein n=1 Tax=Entomophthora muscae TaxID=34485 RepID=A0ACC2S7Y5_9FUNG|nr:hypothetical protein DSO57_1012632 [Entomophthora muscae]